MNHIYQADCELTYYRGAQEIVIIPPKGFTDALSGCPKVGDILAYILQGDIGSVRDALADCPDGPDGPIKNFMEELNTCLSQLEEDGYRYYATDEGGIFINPNKIKERLETKERAYLARSDYDGLPRGLGEDLGLFLEQSLNSSYGAVHLYTDKNGREISLEWDEPENVWILW